ncbi:hypothetical protein DSN97_06260 [Deferribacteraceae bacterium V6Fe1]|nr:hypothetical protein DSN97_06260 [Deferribacteraceae bacterium V6Fe1]
MNREKKGVTPFFLSFNQLTYSINSKKIIDIESYETEFSNILLIKGKVGSGKTTLLKILSDILVPSSGSFSLKCKDDFRKIFIHSFPYFNFITGRVQDEVNLLSSDSIEYNLNLDKNIDEYSGGELKKMSILMSINAGYNLILADEPFNMLDDFEIENLKNTIIESSKNACFIITTHEDLLDDYSDNIIWLENGNIC